MNRLTSSGRSCSRSFACRGKRGATCDRDGLSSRGDAEFSSIDQGCGEEDQNYGKSDENHIEKYGGPVQSQRRLDDDSQILGFSTGNQFVVFHRPDALDLIIRESHDCHPHPDIFSTKHVPPPQRSSVKPTAPVTWRRTATATGCW